MSPVINPKTQLDNFRNDMHLIETWMLSLRHKEEIENVESEIVTYWMSLRRTVICLQKEKENCQIKLLNKKETLSNENLNGLFILIEVFQLIFCFRIFVL